MRTDGGDYNIPFAFLKKRGDKKTKPIFFSKKWANFCPPCQIKQWAFVQWDIVQWAIVLVGYCPSGLLSVPPLYWLNAREAMA